MGFIDTIFGRKKPTSAIGAPALAALEAQLEAARERSSKADSALSRLADMSDGEHAAAIIERDAAMRAVARLEAQAAKLRETIAELEKAETAAAKKLRRDEAEKRLIERYPALTTKYEALAAEMAGVLSEIAEIDAEVSRVNYEMWTERRADNRSENDIIQPIMTSDERFRSEPDHIEPDRTVVDKVWRSGGKDIGVVVTVERGGKMVPEDPSVRLYEVERVVPGRRKPGRRLSSPASNALIPAARIGQAAYWPRPA